MQLSKHTIRTLDFPIGDTTYVVHPVGVDDGLALAELLGDDAQKKLKVKSTDLFRMAMGRVDPTHPASPFVWNAMADGGVPLSVAFRAGMACLVHFQTLLHEDGPDAWDRAEERAAAIWESGLDPEALAASVAALQQTQRSTRPAAAPSTPKPASGTGTRTTATKTASRSRGQRSAQRGR